MFKDAGVSKNILQRPVDKVKFMLPTCIICGHSPWLKSILWAVDKKICRNCISLVEYNYQNVKDELTLEEYIETIIVADNLTKEQ